jgi:hypothetical protein
MAVCFCILKGVTMARSLTTVCLVLFLLGSGCTADCDVVDIADSGELNDADDAGNPDSSVDTTTTYRLSDAGYSSDYDSSVKSAVRFYTDCYGRGMATDADRYLVSEVLIAYDDCSDATPAMSATKIAYLTQALFDEWDDTGLPNSDKVREHLSYFEFVSVHTEITNHKNYEMARLRYPDLYAEDPEAALDKQNDHNAFVFYDGFRSRYVDFDAEAHFFAVVESYILTNGWDDIVLHEILHAALWAAYDDADGKHLLKGIWTYDGDDQDLMTRVLVRYRILQWSTPNNT